jgi:hypothetical protein
MPLVLFWAVTTQERNVLQGSESKNTQESACTKVLALKKIAALRYKKCMHYFDVEVHWTVLRGWG